MAATAVLDLLKTWGAPIVSFVALVVSALGYRLARRADRRASREHDWKAQDREREKGPAEWCTGMKARLRIGRPGIVALLVPAEHHEDAHWGEQQGFFTIEKHSDGGISVRLPPE